MANRFFNPNVQYFDNSGNIAGGALLYFYVTGTSTPATTYADETLETANANPVVCDSAGRAGNIFLDPAVTYKAVLKTSADVTIWTADPVVDPAANVTAAFSVYAGDPNGNVAGNAGTVGGAGASAVYDIANGILYICTTTGTASTAVWTNPAASLAGAIAETGVISPSTIAANTDNYAPSGGEGATIWRLEASAAYNITGIDGGAAGRKLRLINKGETHPITFLRENAGSDAENRFLIDGDLRLDPQKSAELWYDSVSSRWRAAGFINVHPLAPPGGRLTLTTATPVLTSDVTAATTIYYTPYIGFYAPLFNGVSTVMANLGSELSLALSSDSGHTGYHQSGKNFDLFVVDDNGTKRLVSGPAWTSDTSRSAALAYKNGFLTNSGSMTGRFGSAAGNTITVAANQGLYVGTFRASANGQTEMTFAPNAAAGGTANKLFLWNMFNRVPVSAVCRDSTNSWNYTTATLRSANNSTSNRISFVVGAAGDRIAARHVSYSVTSNTADRVVGIGLDATNAHAAGSLPGWVPGNGNFLEIQQAIAFYSAAAPLGFHELNALEYSEATGTTTWYGDNGGTLLQMGLMAELRM